MSVELILALIKPLLGLGLLLTNTILLIWLERKVVAGMQSRVGPDRAGPFGILQTLADAIKLLLKEQILPMKADKAMYLGSYYCFSTIFSYFYDHTFRSWF